MADSIGTDVIEGAESIVIAGCPLFDRQSYAGVGFFIADACVALITSEGAIARRSQTYAAHTCVSDGAEHGIRARDSVVHGLRPAGIRFLVAYAEVALIRFMIAVSRGASARTTQACVLFRAE